LFAGYQHGCLWLVLLGKIIEKLLQNQQEIRLDLHMEIAQIHIGT
jgi:hypothetical protein